jgi:hypothetical protein
MQKQEAALLEQFPADYFYIYVSCSGLNPAAD